MRVSAFEQMYRQYYGAVYHYALSLARDPHIAEDLAQETFAKAMLSVETGKSGIATWLHVVCRNLWIDRCRRDKRLLFMDHAVLEKRIGAGRDGAEDAQSFRFLIDRLPTAMREAVVQFYHSGMSCAEIARLQHTTPGAIRTLLYRARIQLKKIWEDDRNDIP